ncbi:hypothetical protein, partial [Sporisorium scitamineum]
MVFGEIFPSIRGMASREILRAAGVGEGRLSAADDDDDDEAEDDERSLRCQIRDRMTGQYAANDLSDAALGSSGLRIQDGYFIDSYGRTVNLHGVNVAGSCKLPATPNGLSHLHEGFYESHRFVSFVGRPFPLSEAPLHFARLRAWGLPLIRLLVTWESISHKGPTVDDMDTDYIDYLEKLFGLMAEYGLKCFVCAHQDVWSRFSGGSGAPGWTFEVAGMDVEAFTETGAAYIHCVDEKFKRESEK